MSAILDGALVKFLRERNFVAPGHFVSPNLDKIKGGFVKKPISVWGRRFYKHTTCIDVTSSYPTGMVVLNMSPETFIGKIYLDNVFHYQVAPGDDGAKTLLNRKAALTLDVLDLLPENGDIWISTEPQMSPNEAPGDTEKNDNSFDEDTSLISDEFLVTLPTTEHPPAGFSIDAVVLRNNLSSGLWNISGDGTLHKNPSSEDEKGVFASFIESGFTTRKLLKRKFQKHRDAYDLNHLEEDKVAMDKYNTGQLGWKLLLNASYGQLASRYNRLYNPLTAQGITSTGQAVVLNAEQWINIFFQSIYKKHLPALQQILKEFDKEHLEIPFWDDSITDRVVTMDTDSVVFALDDLVESVFPDDEAGDYIKLIKAVVDIAVSTLNTFMNAEFKVKRLRSTSNFSIAFEHEAEKISDGAMYLAKKKYIIRTANTKKLKITGFELKKVNMSEGIREELEILVNYLLDNGKKLDMNSALLDFLNRAKKLHNLLSIGSPQEVANRLSYSVAVNNLEKYIGSGPNVFGKSAPIHVKGALIHNMLLRESKSSVPEIFSGDRVRCLKIKPPLPKWTAICFKEELPKELMSLKPDVAQIVQVDFIQKGQKLLGAFGWEMILTNLLKFLNRKPKGTDTDYRTWIENPAEFTEEEISFFIKKSLGI
jgi:DNA polymerase elongation subunit (family B)